MKDNFFYIPLFYECADKESQTVSGGKEKAEKKRRRTLGLQSYSHRKRQLVLKLMLSPWVLFIDSTAYTDYTLIRADRHSTQGRESVFIDHQP